MGELIYQINNISEYLRIIEKISGNSEKKYFRGQLEKYTSTLPSVARDEGYLINEEKIFSEAIRMRSDDFENMSTPLECLAKLQHYDIPTRLTDVTIDPLIALYFAVQNDNDLSAGVVFLYLTDGVSADSKSAKLLSIMPSISDYSNNNIIDTYNGYYDESLTEDELLSIIDKPVFIQYTKAFEKTNQRLYNQKGTFLICGNELCDKQVRRELVTLDAIYPDAKFCIPYEYKKTIKDELDLNYEINSATLFPELPSVASYVKEKYAKNKFVPNGKYNIVEEKNVSHALAKRISVFVVLNEALIIEQIKAIAILIMEKYKPLNNVIWVFVARNGDDYINHNWILRSQWIDTNLPQKYKPSALKVYEKGYYWSFSKSYRTMSDYYNDNCFDDDKKLYLSHKEIFETIYPIYKNLFELFKTGEWDNFVSEVIDQKNEIRNLYRESQEMGISHNKKFNDFLNRFSDCIVQLDNIIIWVERMDIEIQSKKYLISKCFANTRNEVEAICRGLDEYSSIVL